MIDHLQCVHHYECKNSHRGLDKILPPGDLSITSCSIASVIAGIVLQDIYFRRPRARGENYTSSTSRGKTVHDVSDDDKLLTIEGLTVKAEVLVIEGVELVNSDVQAGEIQKS